MVGKSPNFLPVAVMGAAAFLLMASTGARAQAVNAYLKIPGVKGEATDPAHRGWIEVHSFQWGDLQAEAQADREASQPSVSELAAGKSASRNATAAAPAAGSSASGVAAGKRMHKPLMIVKEWGAASPQLVNACASGKHFPTLALDVVSGGQTRHYHLINAEISSFQTSGANDRPTESISFTFQKIEVEYH